MTTCRSRAIIEDTRQQIGKHDHKNEWWMREGVSIVRSKLAFGDYAYAPLASVDTKKDLYELAMDLTKDHDRFRRECVAARDAGCQLVVLTETTTTVRDLSMLESWTESERHFQMRRKKNGYAKRISGKTLARTCRTMRDRYGVLFDFCAPSDSAARVQHILDHYEGADDERIP